MTKVLLTALKYAVKAAKTLGRAGKVIVKAGAKVAPKVKQAAIKTVDFAKRHPDLVKTILAGVAVDWATDKIEEFLASKGHETNEVKAWKEFVKSTGSSFKDVSESALSEVFDNLAVDDSEALKFGNHPPLWFPDDEKVTKKTASSPTEDSDYPTIDQVMVRNYIYGLNEFLFTDDSPNPALYNQLKQTVAAYYKGLSLEMPDDDHLRLSASAILRSLAASYRALSYLIAKRRYDSGWLAPINNQPGAAGFVLGLYDNSRGPSSFFQYNNPSSLPTMEDPEVGVLQGIIKTRSSATTPTATLIPENTSSSFETANFSKRISAGVGLTAEERDRYYGVTVSNKKWMELVTRVKTLPISQAAANFLYYLFDGVFEARNPKIGSGRDILVFHPESSVVIDSLSATKPNRGDIISDLEAVLTSAESAINYDRSIQTILNYMGMYTPIGGSSAYKFSSDDKSKDSYFNTKDWRSSSFVRAANSDRINIHEYTEDLYKAIINADMFCNVRVKYNIQGTNVDKKLPMIAYSAGIDAIYWDRQSNIKPGEVFDLKTKYEMVRAGEVASATKFAYMAYLKPSWFMQYDTTGPSIAVNCRVPSVGMWVTPNDTSGVSAAGLVAIVGPENLIRPNADPVCYHYPGSPQDDDIMDSLNFKFENRVVWNKGYAARPMQDVDDDYVITRIPDLNTVYEWQYYNLLLGTTQLKPIIDKLQRIEVSAAGRI